MCIVCLTPTVRRLTKYFIKYLSHHGLLPIFSDKGKAEVLERACRTVVFEILSNNNYFSPLVVD